MISQAPKLPALPGVYLFKNAAGGILYIGKAKSLAQRIKSYFAKPQDNEKMAQLLTDADTIDHIVTHSEHAALLLEEYLIKLHQPIYNVLLTSGEPFIYLVITQGEVPELRVVRDKKIPGTYFGPFIERRSVRRAYEFLLKTFQLYRCHYSLPEGCLKYHLGICAGTCTGSFNVAEYKTRLVLVQHLLEGDVAEFKKTVAAALRHAQETLHFEYARKLHEYERDLEHLFSVIEQRFSLHTYRPEIARTMTVAPEQRTALAGYVEAEQALQKLFQTDAPFKKIDCFDISHHQSRQIVGSCVRFVEGVPDTSAFRRFKIGSLEQQNDYAALQEVVTRRYRDQAQLPDLILIDGGKGQLHAVEAVIPAFQRCAALAKREERLYIAGDREGRIVDVATPLGTVLIALRDYAHRFALTYHTLLRKKEINNGGHAKR